MSSTLYEQLLHMKIPKLKKDTDDFLSFVLLGSVCIKAVHKPFGGINPGDTAVT